MRIKKYSFRFKWILNGLFISVKLREKKYGSVKYQPKQGKKVKIEEEKEQNAENDGDEGQEPFIEDNNPRYVWWVLGQSWAILYGELKINGISVMEAGSGASGWHVPL